MTWFANRKSAGRFGRRLFALAIGDAAQKTSPDRGLEKRRAHRVDLNAPVFLYGSIGSEPFTDYSETVDVCSDGALVAINGRLFPQQRILLTNLQTGQDLKCRVVRVDNHLQVAALEFLEACPRFWCIEFAAASTRS